MEQGVYLGLDLATAGARVVAVSGEGTVLAEYATTLPAPSSPAPGHVEQDPAYAEVSRALLRRAVEALGDRSREVGAVSITGTSGTLVPCDRAGQPAGPAVLYNDARAEREASRLRAAEFAVTSTSPLARLGWLHAHRRAPLYLHTPDVVAAVLLGDVPPTDTSHALKAGIDPVAARWNDAALAAAGVPVDAVPKLVHPGTVLGTVRPEVAADCGLPDRVRVVAGMTDGCTAQIASGAVRPGDTVGVLGTTLVLKAVSDTPITGFGGALYSHYAPDGRFWPGGASNVGARLVTEEFPGQELDALERAGCEHGPATTVRYPLPSAGERFPFDRPEAVGFSVGRPGTGADAYRALLEGVAFVERLGLETLRRSGVRAERHRVAGGASGNRLWNRIRATVLGAAVIRPARASSGYGAAVLALSAATGSDLADVVDTVTAVDAAVYEPDSGEQQRLAESYQRFRHELVERGYLAVSSKTRQAGA
jgi:xylulokinase